MAVPASRFIAEIGAQKTAAPSLGVPVHRTEPVAPAARPQARPDARPEELRLFSVREKDNPELRIAQAHAKGLEEGRAAAEAEWSRKLDELRAYHEKQLSVERLTWAGREAEVLAEKFSDAIHEMETRIADTAAELLRPFLMGAAHQRAVGDLARTIEALTTKEQGVPLEVAGPEDLLRLLKEKLSGKNIALHFTPGEGPEIRVIAGQTVLETQLAAWVAKVEEALR